MLQITIEEKLVYRSIKRAAIVWLLILRLDPEPVTEATAADILAIDRTTARKYLKSLSEVGICSRLGRYNGFILTQYGRQLSLPTELEKMKGKISPSSIINESDNESLKTEHLLLIGEGENLPFDDNQLTYANFPEISQELLKYGIQENDRTRLLLLDLTKQDIGTVARKIRHDPYHNLSETGLFVKILEGIQEQNRSGRRKYSNWEE